MIVTDAGRSKSSYPDEDRDCTVRAFAIACRLSYDVAHQFLWACGRKNGHKFSTYRLWPRLFGRRSTCNSGILSRFIKRHPEGRYVVDLGADHTLAVVDGVVYDNNLEDEARNLRSFVKGAWCTTDITLELTKEETE